MSEQRFFLIYDPSFDDMDAEGCPAFGYVMLFDADDLARYKAGENPDSPAVSMLFTDHKDGHISADLLGWSQLDDAIFQQLPLGKFLALMEQAAQVAIHACRQVGQVPDRLISSHPAEEDYIQFEVHFNDLSGADKDAEWQLAQSLMSGRPYLDS
ncbi:hypothetical protein Q3O60_08860 [Alkalimonas collagenimarina]|uniref:Uncharacterized protein n=1 Tax=Alkalimonas collagenimarina TaxID=400390 RepID=A0ABT9GZ08_9GAMM|nr:hypothetical protein [Alkalimonas collagenimarina]MDP4536297.1 hypothetical protein [Alkalimonas collagenimarina]